MTDVQQTREVLFTLPNPLHWRPAAKILEAMKCTQVSVGIKRVGEDSFAQVGSILKMTQLAFKKDERVVLQVAGDGDSIRSFIEQLKEIFPSVSFD